MFFLKKKKKKEEQTVEEAIQEIKALLDKVRADNLLMYRSVQDTLRDLRKEEEEICRAFIEKCL